MKKTKTQKAITLIALIITIVVLLILAAVAISSITNDGILSYAQNAAKEYNQAVKNEQSILDSYLAVLEEKGDAEVGVKTDKNSTINGKAYSSTNPIIPAGFMPINTATSNWEAADLAAEVKKGLVISDGTSEFVWIPVANINGMAKITSGIDANGRTNYQGVLYDFTSTGATEKTSYGQSTESYREPVNLSSYDATTSLSIWTETLYQESFNKMVESVAKYKGFYVGRYEMSINATSGKAESTAGATSVYNSSSANNWWGLYEKATTYSTSGVISEMIWGCQYDAIMRWLQGNSINVKSTTPTDTSRGVVASRNETRVTGSTDSNDILNNIYDILGNSMEWTQEANDINGRVHRGGYYNASYYPEARNKLDPNDTQNNYGSRLTLYVEI